MKCEQCNEEFIPYVGRQRFCCRGCSDAWWIAYRSRAMAAYRQQQATQVEVQQHD
jgi:hypothetical protein